MASSGVVEAFTALAARYEEEMDRELRMLWGVGYDAFVARLTELAEKVPGGRVLDVATGTARIPAAMADGSDGTGRIVGLDITWRMLTHGAARLRGAEGRPRIALVCASAMAMPLVDGSFDAVICGLGMHHMDVPTALGEMQRALTEGGRLVLITVGARRYWRAAPVRALMHGMTFLYFTLRGRGARARAEAAATLNIYTADEWHEMAAEAGFARIEVRPEFIPRRPWYPYGLILRARKGD
ncbi:MAG: class I SAM-dependent methyltransferase [Chloroflexota bacterium]